MTYCLVCWCELPLHSDECVCEACQSPHTPEPEPVALAVAA